MLYGESEITAAQAQQKERGEKFASLAADRIRQADDCLFSLLPHEELARIVSGWYAACAEAMLRGNYSWLADWIRIQSDTVAAEGFALEDLLQLLRICRNLALVVEKWKADLFSDIDDVIKEELSATRIWTQPLESVDLAQKPNTAKSGKAEAADSTSVKERRAFGRNRLQLPIRVVSADGPGPSEITNTQNISKSGLYFVSKEAYQVNQMLKVWYPYWTEPGSLNMTYSAKVIRVEPLPDQRSGVSLQFLGSLGRKAK